MDKTKKFYAATAFFSAAGLAAAFWQLLDKLNLLAHPGAQLGCNLNNVFNCTTVLNSHQYEILGFPNAMLGMVMFTFFLTFAVAGLTGSKFAKKFALFVQFMALFMLGFILWFVFESIYRIHAMCLFCCIIGPAVLVINALMLRLNRAILPGRKYLDRYIENGADIFVWSLVFIATVFAAFMKFKA